MEQTLLYFGTNLEQCVRDNNERDAGKQIKSVSALLEDNIDSGTLNRVISQVFDDPYNILKFFNQIKDRDKWKSVLSEGLDFISHFLKNFYNSLRPYVVEITKSCRNIAFSRAGAFQKGKAIEVICHILNEGSDIPTDDVEDIYNKFESFAGVHQNTTATTVQKNVLILLGVIAKKYPYIIEDPSKLIDMYSSHLKRQSTLMESNRDKNVVSGCVSGLSYLLETFPLCDEARVTIYQSIKNYLMSPKKTYDVRDVLVFLSKYFHLFAELMYNDSPELWHQTFREWIAADGENRKAGFLVLEAFYVQLASVLKTRTEERDKKIFQHFYNYFLQTMKTEQALIAEVRLSIRGFGAFSGPCEVHMNAQNLSQMFIIIVNRIEQDYFVKEQPSMEQLEYLPDYIHCFSTILHQIGEYSFDQIDSLQQISVLMIRIFPRLSPMYHSAVFDSLILSMCYIYQFDPRSLETFLERVVYQGILWTCSHRTTFDVDLEKAQDENKNSITYKSFFPLWKNMLTFDIKMNEKYNKFSVELKKSVVRNIFDELIKTLLLLINKLNLNTKSKLDAEVPEVDPETAFEAEKVDDFVVFINIVDLYTDLISFAAPELFKRWIKMYTNQIILKSTSYPLVSGFYKLLKLALQISDRLNYFNDESLKKDGRKACFQVICTFLADVLLKVQEFKDDLQIACLQLILSVPVSFAKHLLPSIEPVFQMAFTVGHGYLKLAETAIDTLERWYEKIPIEDLNPLLKDILPQLDPYLRSKGYSGDPDIKTSVPLKNKPRKSKRKVYIENYSELTTLQNKILMFVGQLKSEMCMYLVESNVKVASVTWDKEPQLKFAVPYSEVKPNIYLDKLVPRIVELALSSGDPKTRTTACELLHAIIIFMLGTCRQMPATKSKQLSKLFEKLVLPMIQLGCDANDVVRQLFNPLVFQLVHWYSSPLQLWSSETTILIDALMDGISHPNNTAVRDLSGKCIKEFVVWTIKQCQREDLEKHSHNIKFIVNKICLFSLHPNAFKRLGAALAFNNLYTYLREEDAMIEMYWFELSYSLLISMSLEAKQATSKSQIDQALNHIERVLREKSILFNRYSHIRRVPFVLQGPLLEHLVLWILQQTCSINPMYRRKCMKLFCSLSAYVTGCSTVKGFIVKFVENTNINWSVNLYETDGLNEMPTIASCEHIATVDVLMKWLQYLLRVLDAYKLIQDYNIVTYCNLMTDSRLHTSLQYFIEFISTCKLNEAMKLFPRSNDDFVLMPVEMEDFNKQKCSVILGILDFFSTAIDKCTSWCDQLCTTYLWEFFCKCVFQPQVLGFDPIDKESTNLLNRKLIEVLDKFYKKLPSVHLINLCEILSTYFNNKYEKNIPIHAHNISIAHRQLLKGLLLLQKTSISEKISGTSVHFQNTLLEIFESLTKETDGFKTGVILYSTVQEYANYLLKLAMKLTDQVSTLTECITNKESIKHPQTYLIVTHGEYFMETFKEIVMEYIAKHFPKVVGYLCSYWKGFEDNYPLVVLIKILKYITEKKYNIPDVTDTIISCCSAVFDTSLELSLRNRNFQIEFMTHIMYADTKGTCIIGQRHTYFKMWFIQQLQYNPVDLSPKNLLQFQTNVLSFLHCITGPEDEINEELQSALASFQNKFMLGNSDQLDNSDRIVIFKKMLDYLILSKSRIVLESIVNIFCAINYDENDINIERALHLYLRNITPALQYKSLCIMHNLCFNRKYNHSSRLKLAQVFLCTFLRVCSYDAFEEFFIQNIKSILDNMRQGLTTNQTDTNILIDKSLNLILIEALFAKIKINGFTDNTCAITKAAFTENVIKEKQLLIECTKLTKMIRKENLQYEDLSVKEFYRLYQCNAYNALVSIISNTKKSPADIDIYSYLFRENKKSGDVIWNNIIDCSKKIAIPQDFDMLPSRKKIFVNIRQENNPKKAQNQMRYIESQNLFNSTLSEDVCKFDFTNTLVRKVDLNNSGDSLSAGDSLRVFDVESVDINNHECMGTVCGLIRHLIDNRISPLPPSAADAVLPQWMDCIRKIMLDPGTEINVKIFFARVIHNTKYIFKHYAKFFFECISKFIVDKCTGDNINYFVADLVEMLIIWSDNIPLTEISSSASDLIKFLMNHAHNDRRDVLKYNLEIIKTAVETWKSVITVLHDVLYAKICPGSREKLIGVHLVGIVLPNDLIPWTHDNINEFTKALVDMLKEGGSTYKQAAEVLGMMLKLLENDPKFPDAFANLCKRVEDVLNPFKADKLFNCLEQIQINYPVIIDKYIRKISIYMFSAQDTLKCIGLKNILRRFDFNEYRPLTTKDMIEYVKYDNHKVRLLTLQIVNKSIPELKLHYLETIIKTVCELKNDPNEMIRCAVYDVLITSYKKCAKGTDDQSKNIIKLSKPILLSALVDSDSELQKKIQDFWFIEEFQSLNLAERFVKSVTDLYSPDTELYYLGYVNYLLLEACVNTPEFNKLMFEHPLSDCKFDEYELLINWRAQNASMAPLFASSLTATSRLDNAVPELIGVRASTSAKAFQPTPSLLNLSASLESTSSFVFSTTSNLATQLRSEHNFEFNDKIDLVEDSRFRQHGRRFLKDQNRAKAGFAKYAVDKKGKSEEQRKDRVKKKEASVVMYRNYRKGELPDIQIPNSAVLKPLQMLARRDSILARQLFVMLFNGLTIEMNNDQEFISGFNDGINSVFSQTYMYVPNVIGALLDISFEYNKKKHVQKIHVDSDTLSTVCRNSGLLPVGCLLLEGYIGAEDETPSSAKRGCGTSSDSVNQWVKLADMYKELNEWDVVIGIFSSSKHMECSTDAISMAISSEANGKWRDALTSYHSLILTDTNSSRKDCYYESYFKCYSNLSEWQQISQKVNTVCGDEMWDGNWHQEKMLPWYMTAEVCSVLEGETSTILDNLNNWMKDKDKAEYLKDRFSEELAILALHQNDINASKHYVQNCFSKFLEDWSHLNPLFPKIRSNKLANLQKIVDLNKYLLHNENDINNLLCYWQRNSKLYSPSVTLTEIRMLYRKQLYKSLEQKLIADPDLYNSDEIKPVLNELSLESYMNLIIKSLDENNYSVARKYTHKIKNLAKLEKMSVAGLKLSIAVGKVGVQIVQACNNNTDKLNRLIDSWKKFDLNCKDTFVDLYIDCAQHIYKITQTVYNIFKSEESLFLDYSTKFQHLASVPINSKQDILNHGSTKLQEAIATGESSLTRSENVQVRTKLIDAYMSFVLFVQNEENGEEYNSVVVKYVLRGMKLESRDARQIFPCLLQMPELGGSLKELFKMECESVPTWMFLRWIPQLLAILDLPCGRAVDDIVLRIATIYPQALMYAYRLSREKYDLNTDNVSFKTVIEKLDILLNNDLLDKFLFELSCICVPELYFNYHLDRIKKYVNSNLDHKEIVQILKKDVEKKCESSKQFKSILSSFKHLEQKINECTNVQEIIDYILNLRAENSIVAKKKNNKVLHLKLKEYSSWLANFQASKSSAELEIPGQYSGESKPLVQYHAKISSFNSKISIFTSLRKPFNIIIHGNDSKEYSFLIKFGEDLRQDQRIQQLFSLANNILLSDASCQQRNLYLEQYDVIPLTSSLGLIRMVENTKSLNDFIYHAAEDEKCLKEYQNVRVDYIRWICGNSKERESVLYARACTSLTKHETVRTFTRLVNAIPADILNKAFWSISNDTECYISLRHQFITSYATMCIVQWLFGIGDRNLQNCMVKLNSGRAVGIDFGYAFGAATQYLPIPELIPFRLTPHILSLMEPLREIGFVENTMIHCLRALRKHKHILASTMSVFIKEPSVDWLEYAKSQDMNSDSSSNLWYPNQKVSLARRKLEGANPAAVTAEELRNGCFQHVPQFLDAYLGVVKGDESNIRSRMPAEGLTEENQVQCLLDQATDYNILGRMYDGLQLWI